MPPKYWRSAWRKDFALQRLSGPTCTRLRAEQSANMWADSCAADLWARSSEASLASPGATPVKVLALRMSEIYGPRVLARLRSINPESCSSKMSQASLLQGESTGFARTSTEWATAVRSASSVRRKSARVIDGTEFSSLESWGTSRVTTNGGRGTPGRPAEARLEDQAADWPTASVADSRNLRNATAGRHPDSTGHAGETLCDAIQDWPTPNANPDAPNNSLNRGNGQVRARLTSQCLGQIASDWQTPATDSFRSRGGDRKDEQGLDQQARDWATPRTITGGKESKESKESRGAGGMDLQQQAADWPTPNSGDGTRGTQEADGKRCLLLTTRAREFPILPAVGTPQGSLFSLQDETPLDIGAMSSTTGHTLPPHSETRKLNPFFVEYLMGWFPGSTSALIDLGWAVTGLSTSPQPGHSSTSGPALWTVYLEMNRMQLRRLVLAHMEATK